ncbi:hypothetical protein KJ781_03675 [Patescibacteria group bacterium]|nr:hypothetical protein [Patescibacteria group bacterium]MBU1448480.1 hypothetical protein [Patescibacteria group bacterium]MBU2613361.1 hypothetical protein [Patescibacteria group bacterium]
MQNNHDRPPEAPQIRAKDIFVDPRHVEHSFDLPFWRDDRKLWALKIPAEDMDIDDLRWILDVPFWEDTEGNIVITPSDVIRDMDRFPDHRDRILRCDTSHPIDIMKNRKGEWLTLDGLHRLVKQILEGKKTIRVRKIPPEMVHLTAKDDIDT